MDDAAEPGRVRPEDLRAGDADRALVLERLRTAYAEGRLDTVELDERIAATLAARTYGELAALTADLPGEAPAPRVVPPSPAPPEPSDRDARDLRGAVVGWAGVSITTIVIWVVTGIVAGALSYPWWIWVAGPWGLVLLVSWIGTRAHGA